MASLYTMTSLTSEEQKKIVKSLTLRATKRVGREIKKGPPVKFYSISEDKKYVALPKNWSKENISPKPVVYEDETSTPPFKFTGKLWDSPEKGIDQTPVISEALKILKTHNTVLLELRTGFGKTMCSSYLSCSLQQKTLILLNMNLLKQWENTFKKNTTAIFHTVSAKSSPEAMRKAQVIICMTGRFHYVPEDVKYSIKTLILDETRQLCVPGAIPALLGIFPKYIIGCSATPSRNDGMDVMMTMLLGTHSVVRKFKGSFDVTKINTRVVPPTVKDKNDNTNYRVITSYLVTSKERNRCLIEQALLHPEEKSLIFVWFQVHVELVYSLCKTYGLDVSCYYGDQKSYPNAKVVVGSIKKMGIGFDEEGVCEGYDGTRLNHLIMGWSTTQPELLIQYVGRVLRSENPRVTYLVDDHGILEKHWKVAKSWMTDKDKRDEKGLPTVTIKEEVWKDENIDSDEFSEAFDKAASEIDLYKRLNLEENETES